MIYCIFIIEVIILNEDILVDDIGLGNRKYLLLHI